MEDLWLQVVYSHYQGVDIFNSETFVVCPEEVNFLRDVAGGGPQPFSGAGFLGDMVSLC